MSRFQITVDCADPGRQATFWASALGYTLEPPPAGFDTWRAYWLSIGVPADELGSGDCVDSIVDPAGDGPRIWFQQVPESKSVKNRLHFDVKVGGKREEVPLAERRRRVEAEVERLVAAGASVLARPEHDDVDHYGVAMLDPEGNEFDIA